MGKGYSKCKYAIIFIILLFAFICGLNYKQWYVTNHLVTKRISLIYSFAKNEIDNESLEKILVQEFKKWGIEAIFDRSYLNCNQLNEKKEIEYCQNYLESLKSKSTDLILAIGDQATYSILSTRHPLLSSMPVLACNVHFPNEKLIEEYNEQKVYVLSDIPDLKRNIDFIKTLHPRTNMDIIYNIDFTFLGRKSFDMLTQVVDRKSVRVLNYAKGFTHESEYYKLKEMVKYFDLTSGIGDKNANKDQLSITLCPFRYIQGTTLLVMLEYSKQEQEDQVFLLDKFDMMSVPITNALNVPSFSCIREGFNGNAKIVGGYMATEEISAEATADLAVRLMKNEKIGMPKIRALEKEYILDWNYFSQNTKHKHQIPTYTRIINYPLYDRYRKELYALGALFVIAFILISVCLLRARRHSLKERKNLRILEEAQKRLSLSVNGGHISPWNAQDDIIEFDANYTNPSGLKQQKFTRDEIRKYTHPDDVLLLKTLYETMHQSPGMQMQRIRFSFGNEEGNYQWYELRCSSMKDTRGKMMMAGVIQNIQAQVEREEQLILAKQIAENAELKQSFLNNMSHEIRTPLNAIVGFTNILVGEGSDQIDPEEKAMMLELVNHNNDLLLKLVNDVLEISRLESGGMTFEMEECDLKDIVKEIFMTYEGLVQPTLQFHLEMDESIPLTVRTDRFRLTQVISNLLNNANKFTKEGEITLGCKINKEHNEVCIYVQDTGKGIDEQELIMIFDRFYKTNEFEQGSGLGLSISKVIVERLGGRIEVQSEVGKGSCFTVLLPLTKTTESDGKECNGK